MFDTDRVQEQARFTRQLIEMASEQVQNLRRLVQEEFPEDLFKGQEFKSNLDHVLGYLGNANGSLLRDVQQKANSLGWVAINPMYRAMAVAKGKPAQFRADLEEFYKACDALGEPLVAEQWRRLGDVATETQLTALMAALKQELGW